jgi:hypothetical protein
MLYGRILAGQTELIQNFRWLIKDGLVQYVINATEKQFQIVEASIHDGRLVRNLFTFEPTEDEIERSQFKFAWSSTLKTVSVFRPFRTDFSDGQLLDWTWITRTTSLNMNTSQNQTNADSFRRLFTVGQTTQSVIYVELCPNASPQGDYLSIVLTTSETSKLILVDHDMTPIKVFGEMGCPFWSSDGNYLFGWKTRKVPSTQFKDSHIEYIIVEYNVATGKTSPFSDWFTLPGGLLSANPLVSPDRNYIAALFYLYLPAKDLNTSQVFVVSRGGIFQPLEIPYDYSSSPIWIPPLIDVPVPTSNIIASPPAQATLSQ